MSATDDTDDDEQHPPTLAEAFERLAGDGWHRVEYATDRGGDRRGFTLAGHRVVRNRHGPETWYHVGSWTTGAGEGWRHYRGADVAGTGHTVDWIDASSWPESYGAAYLAVHDDDGRGAKQHGWREGSPPDADRALRSDD